MQTQATITIACRSGQVYETIVGNEIPLPFQALGTYMRVDGVEQRDVREVRLGVCVARFAMMSEDLYQQAVKSTPPEVRARYLGVPVDDDEVDEFAQLAVTDFVHWGGLNEMLRSDRAELKRQGVVTQRQLNSLKKRLNTHTAPFFRASESEGVPVTSDTMPDPAMRRLCDYEGSLQMFDATQPVFTEHLMTYLELRHRGVTQQILLSALTAASEDAIRSGLVTS